MKYEVNCKIFKIKRKSINKKDTHKKWLNFVIKFSNDAVINNVGIAQSVVTLGY